MRPGKLRSERQNQYNYMTQEEYQNDLKKQIEEKKRQQFASKIQEQQEILDHYKNYDLGADGGGSEPSVYMNDLDQLVKQKQRELKEYVGAARQMENSSIGANQEGLVFQGDMNALVKGGANSNSNHNIHNQAKADIFENRGGLWNDQFVQNYKQNAGGAAGFNGGAISGGRVVSAGMQNNNKHISNENLNTINRGGSSAESERERRLRLRDQERQKRQQGIYEDDGGAGYGKVDSNFNIQAQDINIGGGSNQAPSLGGNQFGNNSELSKRDQIWQQKQQQRAGSANTLGQQQRNENNSRFMQPSVQQQLPIFQNQGIPVQQQPSSDAGNYNNNSGYNQANDYSQPNQLRNSRVALHLNEAIKLDQNISQENSTDGKKDLNAVGILPLGDNELDKRRRDNEKKQRQQEYQQFIAKQNGNAGSNGKQKLNNDFNAEQQQQQQQQQQYVGGQSYSAPQSSQSNTRPQYNQQQQQPAQQKQQDHQPSALMAGGLQQLGVHQFKLEEDKLRKQREYREILDKQSQQKQIAQQKEGKGGAPVSAADRRQQMSEQVFQEVMGSHQKFQPGQYQQPDYHLQQQQPPIRGYSAVEGQRGVVQGLSYQHNSQNISNQLDQHQQYQENPLSTPNSNGGGIFFKNMPSEVDQKKQEIDKKKEYAMQLQQQMALKQQQQPPSRRRGTSQAVPQQQQQQNYQNMEFNNYQQQQPQFNQLPPQQFGQAPMNVPAAYQQQYQQPGFGLNMANPSQQFNQYQPLSSPMYQGVSQINQNQVYQPEVDQYQQQQAPQPSTNAILSGGDAGQHQDAASLQRQKQLELRRDLENQIRIKEEQKRQKKLEQDLYEQKADKEALTHNFQHQDAQRQVANQQQHVQQEQFSQQPISAPIGFQQQVQMPYQQPAIGEVQQNFTRQRTDLSKQALDPNQEQQKLAQKAFYQEELQKQINEKNKRIEEEKQKRKNEDEQYERQQEVERQKILERENNELIKEGKRDPNSMAGADKKRNIRRDQFEPSTDNPTVKELSGAAVLNKPEENNNRAPAVGFNKEDLFSNKSETNNVQGGFQLPINNRREELFGEVGIGGNQILPINQRENLFGNNNSQPIQFQPRTFDYQPSTQQQQMAPQFQQQQMSQQLPVSNYQMDPSMNFSNQMSQPSYGPAGNKMMEEQERMLHMYQQAFQQILEVKSQFFEQAMQMKDNIAKEREQLLGYERLKMQQFNDINSIKAVYSQLGSLLNQSNQQIGGGQQQQQFQQYGQQQNSSMVDGQMINPKTLSQLNNILYNQKQEIDLMSQSGGMLGLLQRQSQQQDQQQQHQYPQSSYIINNQSQVDDQQPNILEQSLSSDTKLIIVPQNRLAQIVANKEQNSQPGGKQNPTHNENQMLATWNDQDGELNSSPDQKGQMHGATGPSDHLMQSLNGTSQLVGSFLNSNSAQKMNQQQQKQQMQQNPLWGAGAKQWGSRPPTSQPPETIQELPNLEDDVNKSQSMRFKQKSMAQESDFNNRDEGAIDQSHGSISNDPREILKRKIQDISISMNQNASQKSLGNTTTINENLKQIDMILNHQQYGQTLNNGNLTNGNTLPLNVGELSALDSYASPYNISGKAPANDAASNNGGRFGQQAPSALGLQQTPANNPTYTQSSFYNHTLQQQKQQELTQQEELQKQMMRIFGNTMQSDNTSVIKETQQESSQDEENRAANPWQLAQQNAKKMVAAQAYNFGSGNTNDLNEDDLMNKSEINIACSNGGTQNFEYVVEQANKRFSSNGFYQPQYQQLQQQQQVIEEEYKEEQDNSNTNNYNNRQHYQEASREVAMGAPMIEESKGEGEEGNHNDDLWNDPDMIQPPVVINNDEEESGAYAFEPHLNMSQSEYTNNQNRNNSNNQKRQPNQSMFEVDDEVDNEIGTLKNLNMLSPPVPLAENEASTSNYNLGQLEEDSYDQVQQQLQSDLFEESRQPSVQGDAPTYQKIFSKPIFNAQKNGQQLDNFQITKKEKDMAELAQLIQRATETTNNLFENSENFKFKVRSDDKPKAPQFANRKQSAKKHIRIGDPFKEADSRTLRKQPTNTNESAIDAANSSSGGDNKRDRDIMDNLDKMISNLEDQKQRISELEKPDTLFGSNKQQRPLSHYSNLQALKKNSPGEENETVINKNRPISGGEPISIKQDQKQQLRQPSMGKYAQMAVSSVNDSQKRSTNNMNNKQQQLGKFAQMALQNSEDGENLLNTKVKEEVLSKYGGDSAQRQYEEEDENMRQQQILRPVSGKSNSNRYQQAALTNSRSRSGNSKNRPPYQQQQQQQPFYDEESEDNFSSRDDSKQGFSIAEFNQE